MGSRFVIDRETTVRQESDDPGCAGIAGCLVIGFLILVGIGSCNKANSHPPTAAATTDVLATK